MPGANSIDGLNSGLNTTEIIDNIIKFERRNAYFLENDETEKTNIITAYKALQAKVLALNAQLVKLSQKATFNASSVTVSDENILSASTSGRVSHGTYDLQVLSLARNHQLASQGFSDESLALLGTGTIEIQMGDGSPQVITIDDTNNSLVGIKQAINNAKIGVTASIINDGSSSNPYRLLLTADKSGLGNEIQITSNLSGALNLNYSTASFDTPEILSFDSTSNSQVSLGATASYTGSVNKVYTFTVQGDGAQTIGTDNIQIDWTDGVNSGAIVVSQADTEVDLVGTGADGLKLSFTDGQLTSGDTFQVSTFAPLIQEASDAKVSFGSSGGTGSPIIVSSDTNDFKNVISNLSFTVARETAVGETVTITTDVDVDSIKGDIDSFIKSYNEVVDYIEKQNTYNKDTNESGVLFGDSTLWTMRYSMSNAIGAVIDGIESDFSQLYTIGIRTKGDGRLAITDSSKLEEALRNNLDDVTSLFTAAGFSSSSSIQYVSSSGATKIGENYNVDITQAATQGKLEGSEINDPSTNPITLTGTNNTIKLKVDGLESEDIILTSKTYTSSAELVNELQAKIDNDLKIGGRGVTVEWVASGTGGYLRFVDGAYGASSEVELVSTVSNSAYSQLGLLSYTSDKGTDVEGTINGEEAEGTGQILRGKKDNETTDGLVLKITLDSSQVTTGVEGTITITKGVAARLQGVLDSYTKSGEGLLDRKISAYQSQIDTIKERVKEIDERLAMRRKSLYQKFYDMETALGKLNATGQYLANQFAGINSNWGTGNQS